MENGIREVELNTITSPTKDTTEDLISMMSRPGDIHLTAFPRAEIEKLYARIEKLEQDREKLTTHVKWLYYYLYHHGAKDSLYGLDKDFDENYVRFREEFP